MNDKTFVKGLRLSELLYQEAVRPLLEEHFPALEHSAALLGKGSEVLGFDTPQSMDHDWGPRLMLFLAETDRETYGDEINQTLRQQLARQIRGYPTNYGYHEDSTRVMAAADDGRFDVFLMAYNFLQMDASERVLEACKEKQIGTALMKTMPVAKYYSIKARIEQMEEEGKDINPLMQSGMDNYKSMAERAEGFIKEHHLENPEEIKEASIRFVLENPNVNTVCCSMKNFDELMDLAGDSFVTEDREAYYKEADKILSEDEVAIIPIMSYDRSILVKSGVTFEYPPFGQPNFAYWDVP